MDIVVCVKRVPLTEEVDIIIDDKKRELSRTSLHLSSMTGITMQLKRLYF